MTDLGTSLIRTVVPLAVGWVIAVAFAAGIELSEQSVTALTLALSSVFTAGYYLLARVLERRWPVLGWLLGSPKPPTYEPPA